MFSIYESTKTKRNFIVDSFCFHLDIVFYLHLGVLSLRYTLFTSAYEQSKNFSYVKKVHFIHSKNVFVFFVFVSPTEQFNETLPFSYRNKTIGCVCVLSYLFFYKKNCRKKLCKYRVNAHASISPLSTIDNRISFILLLVYLFVW